MAGMNREDAEIMLKKFIRYDKDYELTGLYKECKGELVWNCKLCVESEFMCERSFSNWMAKWDWLEKTGNTRNKTVKYRRKEHKRKSRDCSGWQRFYNWGRDHTWLR